jgi:hypothetical protein
METAMSFMDEVNGGGAGLLKYDGRAGTYLKVGTEDTFNTQEFVADIFSATGGYVKFKGKGEAPEKKMGLIFPKDLAPLRRTLGDLDKSAWVKGKFSEEPEDPWRRVIELPLRHKENGDAYTFTATNNNALSAVKDLIGQCRRLPEGFNPIIRLNTASFKGKFGPVKKPVLTITGKLQIDTGGAEDAFDDEIPFK